MTPQANSELLLDLEILTSLILLLLYSSSNHTVHVRTSNNYTAGQRVYISGMLKSSSATTDNGKLITTGVIKGMRTYTLDNTTSAVSDENQVEIHGNVASIASSEQSESLSIANNYTLT